MTESLTADTLIVIPARYHSSRFPGKPLHIIQGKSMLEWVYTTAASAAEQLNQSHPEHLTQVLIATEDTRILEHAAHLGATAVLTSDQCPSGTDRAYAACQTLNRPPRWVVNFQGDAPLTPVHLLTRLITALYTQHDWPVITPAIHLNWSQLDQLRAQKQRNPFSGTCVIRTAHQQALWFSKTILPAIRNEAEHRVQTNLSPVHLHVGLYGYQYTTLQKFVGWSPGHYEQLEGLEQLRLLEHQIPIHLLSLPPDQRGCLVGVDTPADAERAAQLLTTDV